MSKIDEVLEELMTLRDGLQEQHEAMDVKLAVLDEKLEAMDEKLATQDRVLNKTNQLQTRMFAYTGSLVRLLKLREKRRERERKLHRDGLEPLFPHPEDEREFTEEEQAEFDAESDETGRAWKAKYHPPTPSRSLFPVNGGGKSMAEIEAAGKKRKKRRKHRSA